MTDHDPLCPCYGLNYLDAPPGYKMPDCYCDLIASVREKIAQAIETHPVWIGGGTSPLESPGTGAGMNERRKAPDIVMRLVEQEEILLCGVKGCCESLSLAVSPAPASRGWLLKDGWWLCPPHSAAIQEREPR